MVSHRVNMKQSFLTSQRDIEKHHRIGGSSVLVAHSVLLTSLDALGDI